MKNQKKKNNQGEIKKLENYGVPSQTSDEKIDVTEGTGEVYPNIEIYSKHSTFRSLHTDRTGVKNEVRTFRSMDEL